MTLVVIRVVYAHGIPVSVTAPAKFEGENARIEAAAYTRKLLVIPKDSDVANRTEYHVIPVGPLAAPKKLISSVSQEITGVYCKQGKSVFTGRKVTG